MEDSTIEKKEKKNSYNQLRDICFGISGNCEIILNEHLINKITFIQKCFRKYLNFKIRKKVPLIKFNGMKLDQEKIYICTISNGKSIKNSSSKNILIVFLELINVGFFK